MFLTHPAESCLCSSDVKLRREISSAGFSSGDEDEDEDEYSSTVSRVRPIRVDDDTVSLRDTELGLQTTTK